MSLAIFWLIIAIFVFLVDILTSNFCFMLFSAGAIAAAIADALGLPLLLQIILFAIINIVSFIIGYPLLKKKFKQSNRRLPLMEETYIGKVIVSDKKIVKTAQIKVGGEYWTVTNEDEIINEGEKFIITGLEGIKFKIKKV